MINRRSYYINNNVSNLEQMKYDNNIYESSSISLEKVGVKMARSNNTQSTNSRRSCNSKSTSKRSSSRSNSRSNSSSKSESRSKTSR